MHVNRLWYVLAFVKNKVQCLRIEMYIILDILTLLNMLIIMIREVHSLITAEGQLLCQLYHFLSHKISSRQHAVLHHITQ